MGLVSERWDMRHETWDCRGGLRPRDQLQQNIETEKRGNGDGRVRRWALRRWEVQGRTCVAVRSITAKYWNGEEMKRRNGEELKRGNGQIRAAERRPVCSKQLTKDQPSAVAFTKRLTDPFGRKEWIFTRLNLQIIIRLNRDFYNLLSLRMRMIK